MASWSGSMRTVMTSLRPREWAQETTFGPSLGSGRNDGTGVVRF